MQIKLDPQGEPNMCWTNVAQQVEEHGGECVAGYLVPKRDPQILSYIPHCVWRKPDGELLDITPQYHYGQYGIGILLRNQVEFEIDPDVCFLSAPKYVAVDKRLEKCVEYLHISEKAHTYEGHVYWTGRAQQEADKYSTKYSGLKFVPRTGIDWEGLKERNTLLQMEMTTGS